MIAPQPYKYKCSQCGFTKVIKPKCDVMNPTNLLSKCPKCGEKLTKVPLNLFDKIFR
jgi:predicted RNA-binding Zn-ribbon protein involved in translation (DUF1610 family)